MAQDEAPSIQQPALDSNAGGISSSAKDAGGKKSRVGRSVEELKHERVGVGFDDNDPYYFKEITLHGNTSSVVTTQPLDVVSINETKTNFTISTQDILISTTNHTILHIFKHEDRENSGSKLTIVCQDNHNINLGKIEATDDDDGDNEDLMEQDTLIDYSGSTSTDTTTTIENDLSNQRLMTRHSKRNSKEPNLENMLQNDDPRLIAYNDPENVEFVSLDDDKSKSSEATNGPPNVPVMVSAVPLIQPGVPHYVVHDANTPKEIEGPRILVNVSIATDHGSGTQTHAVYMLHVMVPADIDLNPSSVTKEEEKKQEPVFAPENLVLKPIEYVKYPSGRNPNDTPDISINEIDVGNGDDYKGKSDPFSMRTEEQPTKTSYPTLDKKVEWKEMTEEEKHRKTTNSSSFGADDDNETMVANGNNTQKNNTSSGFDNNHLELVIDTKDDEEVTQTTDTISSVSTSSYDEDTIDEDTTTMGGGCNCNHTIPYVLILEGEGKYFGILL